MGWLQRGWRIHFSLDTERLVGTTEEESDCWFRAVASATMMRGQSGFPHRLHLSPGRSPTEAISELSLKGYGGNGEGSWIRLYGVYTSVSRPSPLFPLSSLGSPRQPFFLGSPLPLQDVEALRSSHTDAASNSVHLIPAPHRKNQTTKSSFSVFRLLLPFRSPPANFHIARLPFNTSEQSRR